LKIEPGKVISNRYEVQNQLGSGGMAVVYRALDHKLDRYVTLKIMREDLEEGFIERFYKEAQSIACLSHTNIVKVYDYGEDNGIHYIVMEYVDGTTLKDLIVKKAPFDEETTLGVAVQIAHGLLHAHKNDVIHRDIKPQNILVTHDGSVKIADFGIARMAKATTLTSSTNSMGSVHYFSPEQARGGFVDHKSDIYALGITMFEMATGQLPYDGEAAVTVALKHINEPFPDPREINSRVSDPLCYIIDKATEKSSSKRYADVEAMCYDMKRAINNVEFIDFPDFRDSPTVEISGEDLESIRQYERDYSALSHQGHDEDYEDDYDEDYDDEERPYGNEKTNRGLIITAFLTAAVLVVLITVASVMLYNNLRVRPVNPPDIIGMTVDQATELVEPLDLLVAVVGHQFSEDYEEGIIVVQSVLPQDSLLPGDIIHVILSSGSAYFSMPDLIHTERDVALQQLFDLQLQIEEREYADIELPANIVVSTEPAAGTLMSQQQAVVLYISLGPDNSPRPMISLIGLDEEEAVRVAQEEFRLVVREIIHQPNVMFQEGTVSRQSILPMESVTPGDMIDIYVSTGSTIPTVGTAAQPSPTPEPEAPAEAAPEPPAGGEPDVADTPDEPEAPTAQSDPPTPTHSVLSVALWDVPEGTETVHLRVYQRVDGGPSEMIVNYPLSVNDFPISVPVSGTGLVQYMIYSVDAGGAEQRRAFSELDFSLSQ